MLNVVTWNSQGNKADALWAKLGALPAPANPIPGGTAGAASNDDMLLFVCEAGTPPWINPAVSVSWGHDYQFRYGATNRPAWFNAPAVGGGISQAVSGWHAGGRTLADAMWVPWQRHFNDAAFLRCSISLYWFPGARSTEVLSCTFGLRNLVHNENAGRPVLTATISRGGHVRAVLLFVHLPASPGSARAALSDVTTQVGQVVPQATPLFAGGDFNINAPVAVAGGQVPAGWTPQRTGAPTQSGGGELDWGLTAFQFNANPPVAVWPFKPPAAGGGLSDHSMLWYRTTV